MSVVLVLEEQIEEGIFHVLRATDRNTNCMCFIRTISDVEKHVTSDVAERYVDVTQNDDAQAVQSESKKKALQVLKQKIKVSIAQSTT